MNNAGVKRKNLADDFKFSISNLKLILRRPISSQDPIRQRDGHGNKDNHSFPAVHARCQQSHEKNSEHGK